MNLYKFFIGLIISVGAATYSFSCYSGPLLYENITFSAPRGIYFRTFDQRLFLGDYAIVRLPIDLNDYKLKKGHLLLKKVAAEPGTEYLVTRKSLMLNGKSYPIYNSPYLPSLPYGRHIVPKDTLLFLNEPENSLDSRYLGPIDGSNVVAKVSLLLDYDSLSLFYKSLIHFFTNLL